MQQVISFTLHVKKWDFSHPLMWILLSTYNRVNKLIKN